MVIRITALCVAAALICAGMRVQRPELATAVSLAAGLTALGMVLSEAGSPSGWLASLQGFSLPNDDIASALLKAAGICVLSELGAQLCVDAGERALAGRILLSARIAMLGFCAPMLAEIAGLIRDALQ